MAQVATFWPKFDDSTDRIVESSKNLTEQSRPGTAAVRGTRKSTSTSSDRCVGLRIQPRCLTAARLQLAVDRRGLGPREQGEQRTQRASFVATLSCESTHRAAALVLGSDALLKKNTT